MQFPAITKAPSRRVVIEHIVPVVVLAALSALFLYDRRPPIARDTLAGFAYPAAVPSAGELSLSWSVLRNRVCPTTIAREIVDSVGTVHRYDQVPGPRSETIGWDSWRVHMPIPPRAAWGPARYRSTISYHCGWTHEWMPLSISAPEVGFEILPTEPRKDSN